jgi:hypothetical protein
LGQLCRLAAQTGVRGLVMFSDPLPRTHADGTVVMPGHIGTIYQATNAVYTGRATPRTLTLLPNATVFSDRAAQISCGAGAGTTARSRSERAAGPGAWSARTLDCLWRSSAAAPGTVTCGAIGPLAW